MVIQEILQEKVNAIRDNKYPEENSFDLNFEVGLLISSSNERDESVDKLILTVNHHGYKLTRIIFPKQSHFNYESIEDEMTYLYNSTM